MTDLNAPGCGQILAACALVIFGTLGGCIIGATPGFPDHTNDRLVTLGLGVVGGLIVGAILAGLALAWRGRPSCRQIRVACLLIILGIYGGSAVGALFEIANSEVATLASLIGLVIGIILAARVLRRSNGA